MRMDFARIQSCCRRYFPLRDGAVLAGLPALLPALFRPALSGWRPAVLLADFLPEPGVPFLGVPFRGPASERRKRRPCLGLEVALEGRAMASAEGLKTTNDRPARMAFPLRRFHWRSCSAEIPKRSATEKTVSPLRAV